MSFVTWADSMMERTKKLTWLDMGLIKISIIGFTLMIAKLWKPLLILDWYWYALIFILVGIRPIYKCLKKG
jgi:hypothetical protein